MKLFIFTIVVLFLMHQDEVLGWRRRRRRRRRCNPTSCTVSNWGHWSVCNHQCGNAGIQTRTRHKTRAQSCGGACPYHLSESRACNRNACQNGGIASHGSCKCTAGWKGTCCQHDIDECLTLRPCQHSCVNVRGSYTCSCHSCYTKLGTKCELRQCKIAGLCYPYTTVNPKNQCQNCHQNNKLVWTNDNALKCSDNNACTRNDKCVNGICQGAAFKCRSCETCGGSGCRIKPGFCIIRGICYANGDIIPGTQCLQCNSSNPTTWSVNSGLKCNDGLVGTRNDICRKGQCYGEPYTCLTCQDRHNDTCVPKPGYCVIKFNKIDTCYCTHELKPGDICKWCKPVSSSTTWTNRNGASCNDGQKCTKSDTCKNGQCKGISFSCNNVCQYCNGIGCSLRMGYGYVAEKCTCKIAGKDYNHQHINPANQRQWCDLYHETSKLISAWSNRPIKPAVHCGDGGANTARDIN